MSQKEHEIESIIEIALHNNVDPAKVVFATSWLDMFKRRNS